MRWLLTAPRHPSRACQGAVGHIGCGSPDDTMRRRMACPAPLNNAPGSLSEVGRAGRETAAPALEGRRPIGYDKAFIEGPLLAGRPADPGPNQEASPPPQVLRDSRPASVVACLSARDRLRYPAPAVRSYNALRWWTDGQRIQRCCRTGTRRASTWLPFPRCTAATRRLAPWMS